MFKLAEDRGFMQQPFFSLMEQIYGLPELSVFSQAANVNLEYNLKKK